MRSYPFAKPIKAGLMRFVLWITCVLTLLRLLNACGTALTSDALHVRVFWDEDPQHVATVSWITPKATEKATIYYDTISRNEAKDYQSQLKPESSLVRESRLFAQRNLPYIHHARLKNLSPATLYYFRVHGEGEISEEFSFRTAPEGDALTLLFGGDSRTDRSMRRKMNMLLGRMMAEDPSIAALVHGGDFIGDGKSWPEWSEWILDHHELVRDGARLLPIVATRGNHESDKELYNQLWNAPGQGRGYYLQKYGPISLLILNTEESLSGDQETWLDATLKEQQGAQWIIANYHLPAYPVVKSPGPARGLWVPIFERHFLDLAFESDGHAFKRTAPIYAEAVDSERGIIYAGEGGLGVKQRTPDPSHWYITQGGVTAKSHHVMKLRITGGQAQLETFGEDLQLIDTIALKPKQSLRQKP